MNSSTFTAALLAFHVARSEILSRYARSVLGSFWVTLQQALYVATAGLLFHKVFNVSMADYLPFFAVSLLFWNFLSNTLLESMDALSANAPMVKDRGFSPDIFLFAAFGRNVLISAHALPVPAVLIATLSGCSLGNFLLALPGLASFLVATASVSYVLGLVAVRYRDFKRLIESVLQVAFLVTPILWKPSFVADQRIAIIYANPLVYLFDAWRQPLVEGTFSPVTLALSVAIALVCFLAAVLAHRQVSKIAVWI
jgi:lipopolysaccharide transport system permease protein